ncbi:UDP-2,3-diacylglucosamine diphosphatase [Xylophilus sp.]|uniref:UDP-2,3-diacylglucosamine diphosphatase n=1 Tax=Xylophilus sp. TaxID=2653893 RepID=UPI0013B9B09D|nr:UDP-2,3-diacylglucosamine diphosphatase [Xylophilus sp.]KAF1047098.1 MAG: UDP-2,3-diacylglucosamine hydrolase [Xylophilus sp.]
MAEAAPRCAELVAPPHWRAVDFIADLHLQESEPLTVAAWRDYLFRTPADAVFILGDLFEVWIGDDAAVSGSFEDACGQTLREASQRLSLYFIAGNRDFLLGEAFLARAGMAALADPTVLAFAGRRVLLSHGDALCLDDHDYMRFRAQVRSPAWQAQVLARPLAERRLLARGIRSESASRKQAEAAYADADPALTRQWMQQAGATTLVHGHTHRPADHALPDGTERRVLSDWDLAALPPRAEALRLDAAGFRRIALG